MPRERSAQRLMLAEVLEQLHQAGRPVASPVNRRQVARAHAALHQARAEPVGGHDRVLDGVVDAHAEHRRHDVRGAADQQQAWAVPALDAARLHDQQRRLLPVFSSSSAARSANHGASAAILD
jgi:hypothetical protein